MDPQHIAITSDVNSILNEETPQKLGILIKQGEQISSLSQIESLIIPLDSLEENDAFNKLRSIVNLGLLPVFEMLSLGKKANSESFINITRKKFNELSASLQNLQEKIQVPDLLLSVHPVIKQFDTEQDNFDEALLNDSHLLNEVTNIVNGWTKQIQSITSLSSDIANLASISEEIQFWNSLDISLTSVEQQLSCPQVKNSINLLNKANRFHITLSFTNDSNISSKIIEAKTNLLIWKDFPLTEMTNINPKDSDCLGKFNDSVSGIFNHLKRLRTISNFPLSKGLLLTELILKDLLAKFAHLINSLNLMNLEFEEFLRIYEGDISNILSTIDLNLKYMVNLIRELLRKRQEKFFIVRVNQEMFDQFKHRLEFLKTFRVKHENILFVIRNFLQDFDQEPKLMDDYNRLSVLNLLDFSKHGVFLWSSSERHYNNTYSQIQESITSQLNNLFIHCSNFKDFVTVAEKYKYLMIENTFDISSLMKEDLRLKILDIARTEIFNLIKFDTNYNDKLEKSLNLFVNSYQTQVEDYTVTRFLRALERRNKVSFYDDNLSSLVGKDWFKYSIGGKLKDQMSSFLIKFDPEEIFKQFLSHLKEYTDNNKLELKGNVFKISNNSDLLLNFNPEFLGLRDNLKFFRAIGFKIPVTILLEFQKLNRLLPMINDLKENILTVKRIFDITLRKEYFRKFDPLLEIDKLRLSKLLVSMAKVQWEHLTQAFEIQDVILQEESEISSLGIVREFQACINKLTLKLNSLSRTQVFLSNSIYHNLKTCKFDSASIESGLVILKERISELYSFESTEILYKQINEDIKDILLGRCKQEIETYSRSISTDDSSSDDEDSHVAEFSNSNHYFSVGFRNHSMVMEPSTDEIRSRLLASINDIVAVVEYQTLLLGEKVELKTEKLSEPLANALAQVDQLSEKIEVYFSDWVRIETMINMNVENNVEVDRFAPLDSLEDWCTSMQRLLKLGDLFDSDIVSFGCCHISLKEVQSKVYLKFTSFQRSMTKVLGEVHYSEVNRFDKKLSDAITSLGFDTMDTKNFTKNLLTFIEIRGFITGEWKKKLDLLVNSSKLLPKFNFRYPRKWIYPEQIENKIASISSIMEKKQSIIDENLEFIKSKIVGYVDELSDHILKFKDDWSLNRPISGEMNPVLVLNSLSNFNRVCSTYVDTKVELSVITEAFELDIPEVDIEVLKGILSEIIDFKYVWSSINSLHDQIDKLRKVKWQDVKTRDIRLKLEHLLEECRSLPIKVRQYAAFDEVQQMTKNLMKNHKHLVDLKNPNLKDRHWKRFLSMISYNGKNHRLLTLGDIWDLNLSLHEVSIKSIITQANNEYTLEENIEKIKENWNQITFEYFNFNTKFKLIKSWDLLFEECNKDLNELSSMRNSSSFGAFEQEIFQIETKLNSLYVILDSWIEVQRQWVYLEGIFGSKNNIASLLPVESARFNNLSYIFFDSMKKVYKIELAIDVLLIPDFGGNLEKLLESFSKLRRSLSDFLEKQRESFARFYFMGNEDLLELIGSGVNFQKINTHINKLFSGVASLQFNKESSSIISVSSAQGEILKLSEPVSLIKYPSLVDWLGQLELEIKISLRSLVSSNIEGVQKFYETPTMEAISKIVDDIPCQVLTLCCQIIFTKIVDNGNTPKSTISQIIDILSGLETHASSLKRNKIENIIVEVIHQLDVISLLETKPNDKSNILASELLYVLDNQESDPLKSLKVKQFGYSFEYGFEYLGVPQKLVHTPLISNSFVAMTQALGQKLGGSPLGPAGTGKTESVKALGDSLGKMVTVFCCDESFDFQAMSRIFLGLCKVGCWGCFDEFNRLDEKLLSAVSSQIETIELGLKNQSALIELSGKNLYVNPETGIFVTMNPGYAGRNELPENLKKLFRSFSMERPDKEIIVDVLLASRGFRNTKEIAKLIVPMFQDFEKMLSKQSHYDFGLRSLKSVLNSCGKLKRSTMNDANVTETMIVLRSIQDSILPKLTREDEVIFNSLITKYFSDTGVEDFEEEKLVETIKKLGQLKGYNMSGPWLRKVLQLEQVRTNHHGIILMGDAGAGKTSCWKLLLESLKECTGQDYLSYKIDAKVLNKETLYGKLDPVTREWTDGLLTSILRKIKANMRGEMNKLSWIVFDCDIDPEWAENLNSVLDDNKILTLPNGERLALPDNVRIIFETDNLKSTTLATISRCGMIWFDKDVIDTFSLLEQKLHQFSQKSLSIDETEGDESQWLKYQRMFSERVKMVLLEGTLGTIIHESTKLDHIMDYNIHRYITSFIDFIKSYCRKLIKCDSKEEIPDPTKFINKAILLSLIWSFAGDSSSKEREGFGNVIQKLSCFSNVDSCDGDFADNDLEIGTGEWIKWSSRIQPADLEPSQVSNPNTVVQTTDTVRHKSLIHSIMNEHKTLLLCGPPGSGKTMTFLEVLKTAPNLDILQLNFSKESSPESLMRSLKQYCEYQRTSNGIVFSPRVSGKWVVVFCDEINLPGVDKYGCQKVISLMRQMVEHRGFWDPKEMQWVEMKNIQFVGACNSPKDPGRQKLSNRFGRHVTLIMVDYPGETSLNQIYEEFNLAVMKCAPDLRGYTKSVVKAMISVYLKSKERLTPDIQSHYVYSPRELTRWTRGLLEALKSKIYTNLPDFIRMWYHEGLRLFYDRLVSDDEKVWTKSLFEDVIKECFPFADTIVIMQEPVLFSDWLSSSYESVNKAELNKFISHRLMIFSEEEFDVDLVLYEDFLIHALRIYRVLNQPQGHMILVGASSSGKTTLTKFVAWMNGLKSVQLNVHSKYNINDFDKSLREILIRCAKGERICYIIDEASIMETSFIERMNTLLANSEVPGLFEADDFKNLMNICLEESQAQGLLLDSDEELYKWFAQQISTNLHVVFTLTQLNNSDRLQMISSPALFNRCVLSYMGDWSSKTFQEVGSRKIESIPVDVQNFEIPESFPKNISSFRDILIDSLLFIHKSVEDIQTSLKLEQYPSQFMALVSHFVSIFETKQFEQEEIQRHTTTGLNKLRETVLQVAQLKEQLSKKQKELTAKDREAREMLNAMLLEQNEAERKQEFSITAQQELNKQEVEIDRRRKIALKDLEDAEPAVLEARKGVQNIKKQHLTEIRSMANPPAAVKMAMESVCILIGYQVASWRDIQLAIRKDDFIPNIVNYNGEQQLTADIRKYMTETYLSRPDYTFEVVNRASKACGPLLLWVKAQLTYSSILDRIGPLKEEVDILENGAKKTKAQLHALKDMVGELEQSIEKYKNDYSSLIRETEHIKMEMETVEAKVNKSFKLMKSLTIEKDRWKKSTQEFIKTNERIIGNSILASAFLIYCGSFDQKTRQALIKIWKKQLDKIGVKYDNMISILNLLPSSALSLEFLNERSLDDLVIENATLVNNSRIPLLIDPSLQMLAVLEGFMPKDKLVVTSFLNESLVRDLENAIRFGGSILIKDFENYDPVLDPVLRSEIHRNGGRRMIKIRGQLIDYDEKFKLYLHTRNPSARLTPFIASRVTTINYTITSTNLESQVLNLALKHTEPEIEEKRATLIVLQSQYRSKLKTLETELLDALAEVGGSILDDDKVIEYLEMLKGEANTIDDQIQESKVVLEAIDRSRSKFFDVASHSSSIFELLKEMIKFNPLYRFTLDTFTRIFLDVLNKTKELVDMQSMILNLYKEVFAVISPSLMGVDKMVFSLGLVLSYYSKEIGPHFTVFFKSIFRFASSRKNLDVEELFRTLLIESDKNEISVILEDNSENEVIKLLRHVVLAANNFEASPSNFITSLEQISTFLFSGIGPNSSKYGLEYFIEVVHDPLLLSSAEGYDATFKVEQLAASMNKKLDIISLGSKEGIASAKKEIQNVSMRGGWLLVQNIQMSPEWLNSLETLLQETSGFHEEFRLFLTCNLDSRIPVTLINNSQVIVFESQPGLKRAMIETFNAYSASALEQKPPEYRYIYFLLAWYHSLVLTRMSYVPVSFAQKYDVNDSDFSAGMKSIDKILEPEMKNGVQNISLESVSFERISFIIGKIIYGGKVDNEGDLEYFTNLAEYLFSISSFGIDFNVLFNDTNTKLPKPDGISVQVYQKWIEELPDQIPLSWIGLDNNVDKFMVMRQGKEICDKIVQLF
ncbi:hypothetical protein CANTEDRAFT_131278 [Yamadazyma tenuis ATCC 10573]|uniref:Dynein heavy chain, cytoplasmic n=2 Tax=Candida tenuis TaxID=2315449 RepID=G3B8V7_CANTC|nr:uncharacterized protein CANTEDRAFT_131278 [Yamadazyma tenuis ATCC 10573]EGV61784.1 hypothetical protein CANTEDRAFT_131278 [Yamadazyma tenuis ATCC 10573]